VTGDARGDPTGGHRRSADEAHGLMRPEVREFIHGNRIADRHKMLRGDRVSKRCVPIRSLAEARRAEIADIVRKASTVESADTV
jgi:hypothetical protein